MTAMGNLTIECDSCALRRSTACSDCVVTFVLRADDELLGSVPVELDADQERAVALLARAGLVPRLRHRTAS
jgi:hypothetical protein